MSDSRIHLCEYHDGKCSICGGLESDKIPEPVVNPQLDRIEKQLQRMENQQCSGMTRAVLSLILLLVFSLWIMQMCTPLR